METNLYDTSFLIEQIHDWTTVLDGFTTIFNLIEFTKASILKKLNIIIPGPKDFDKGFEISVML